jgi:uncharacterized damage-inducible protein DinB
MATGGATMTTETVKTAGAAARTVADFFLDELAAEIGPTRKILERVPMTDTSWKPHEKSMPIGSLATHLANLPSWTGMTVYQSELDIAPVNEPPLKMEPLTTTAELLALFDKNVAEAQTALRSATDEDLEQGWTLLAGGHKIFTLSKKMVIRRFVINHLAHHRAQLGVYLRLNGIPIPATYGPSADENE